jgi:hypothetical protein
MFKLKSFQEDFIDEMFAKGLPVLVALKKGRVQIYRQALANTIGCDYWKVCTNRDSVNIAIEEINEKFVELSERN